MRKEAGAGIAQYGIIIALVALALVPVFYTFGQTILGYFEDFYKGLGSTQVALKDSEKNVVPVGTEAKGGDFGGTPSVPVKKCSGSTCTIDFGEYILAGVPANFDEVMRSSGSSGTTEAQVILIEQLADQLEEKGDNAGAEELRKLANAGHLIASVIKNAENTSYNCFNSSNDNQQCFVKNIFSDPVLVPDNIESLLGSTSLAFSVKSKTTGTVLNDFSAFDVYPAHSENQKSPGAVYKQLYSQIAANNNYSDTTKDLIKALSLNINSIGYKSQSTIISGSSPDFLDDKEYDFITGKKLTPDGLVSGNFNGKSPSWVYKSFYTPNASDNANFNSTLICATGGNPDDGTQCH